MSFFGRRRNNSQRHGSHSLDNKRARAATSRSASPSSFHTSRSQTLPSSNSQLLSGTDYARRSRQLLQLNRELEALGAGQFFDLPRVSVIGSQSAGKSSLVEGVSGINVPRDSGTCTRCPMQCIMSGEGEEWSCTLSLLRYEVNESITRINFGPKITDKTLVELWIRRAQAAILSPHRRWEEFYDMTYEELRDVLQNDSQILPFSKDAVEVRLEDPTLTDLSFIDLPGLIQNASDTEVQLVKDLAVHYIGDAGCENTLILIAMPMTDDIQNQLAVKLAKSADPEGKRSIGVATKPDLLTAGSIGQVRQWRRILEGTDTPFKHGCYCVRLPDDAERLQKLSRDESQRRAEEFFNSTEPWSQFIDRRRFGLARLVSDLSALLVKLIESNLPKLKRDVESLLAQTKDELNQLPPPPSKDPFVELSLLINNFCNHVRDTIRADTNRSLVQINRKTFASFKYAIWSTGLDFRPYRDHTRYRAPSGAGMGQFTDSVIPSPERFPLSSGEEVAQEILDLEAVRRVLIKSIGYELPGTVPFEATKRLVAKSTGKWSAPASACFETVFNNLRTEIERMIVRNFAQYNKVAEFIRCVTERTLDLCKVEARVVLDRRVTMESDPLYTQNYHDLATERAKWKRHLLQIHSQSVLPSLPTNMDHLEYGDEIDLMAGARAYFEVAFKRFVDEVPLLIEHELCQQFASRLLETLMKEILGRPDASENIRVLLCEDPDIVGRRGQLEEKIARLETIKQRLNDAH